MTAWYHRRLRSSQVRLGRVLYDVDGDGRLHPDPSDPESLRRLRLSDNFYAEQEQQPKQPQPEAAKPEQQPKQPQPGKEPDSAPAPPKQQPEPPQGREALEARAQALGIRVFPNWKDSTVQRKIEEAEAAQAG